ncbi:S8 family serine peptidase [Methylosinus sp. Ce-a6]|uniref:S8 family serine peptidase n=1 Tax=Methylosinus sp. Ce-a6 TaxID=2172005 RepID=UPI00135B796C|nr:S8 family serine peptidase [Methylosinus sp. Ce-a6]
MASQPVGSLDDSLLDVSVRALGGLTQPTFSDGGGFGSVLNNQIAGSAGSIVSMPWQAVSDDAAATWATEIGSGQYQPGWARLLDPTSDLTAQTGLLNVLDPNQAVIDALAVTSIARNGLTVENVDPLLIDLAGAGIGVSNWIGNTVYFDTGVKTDGSGAPDGLLHHTSWAKPGTGIVALDLNGNGKIDDITETLSQFFRGGATPGQYADGLAALAALAQSGATAFSAATSRIDPATGRSYWSELAVWNDANQNGVTDAGELRTLAQLGVASIGLVGSGNLGETINGSPVTNRTVYTKSDGAQGEVAAVDFQTDAAGAITVTANGGVIVNSLSEGGPTVASTFVSQNATAHSYFVSGGHLTDQTTGASISNSIRAVLSSNQNDVITVDANDTGTYWLGGGTGADTLYGGGGTNVFLVNADTIVHGGTGAHSFNIAKVIGAQGRTIDMAATHLQEVVGGVGGDVINASGTTWNVFIQGGEGNNIIIGGAATAAIAGGKGDDLIELGPGGGVVHAGLGNDVIYGGSGSSAMTQPNYVNAGGTSNAAFVERLYNGGLGREADLGGYLSYKNALDNGQVTRVGAASSIVTSAEWQAHYGTQTNSQFVTSIFTNLVGRAPSSSELNDFVQALNGGQTTRGAALEAVADNAQSLSYWGALHPGASDVIYAGPGNSVVTLGTNNSEVYVGSGTLTVIGNPNGFSVVGFHGSYADYTLAHNADGTITVTNKNSMDGDGSVTMKDVTALDFKDISQVTIAGAAGMPANDYLYTTDPTKVQTDGAGRYVITASTLLANDIDYAGKTLSIRELLDNNGNAIARGNSGQVNGGSVALSADGSTITFTPRSGYGGVPSFRYHVQDSSGNHGATVQAIGGTNTAEMTATVYLNTPDLPTDSLFDSEWFLSSADVIPVWKDYTGAGVQIAVFDPTGNVDFSNPDLAANSGVSKRIDGSPGVERIGTHATLVAGVIGAARNGAGAVGVAYDATISSEALPQDPTTNLNNLLDWSHFDVVNNSWNFSPPFIDNFFHNPDYYQTYVNAVANGRGGLGTVLVFAGGNDRAGGRTTQDLNETNSLFGITVGGINATTDLGSLVLSGQPFSEPGSSILVSAPANNIPSTGVTYVNEFGQQFGSDYVTAQGTSFATPIVTGVVALMLQANPNLGYRDVQQILAYSAKKVNDPTPTSTDPYNVWTTNRAGNWNGRGLHYSLDYGFGEVDARAAVRLAETWQNQETFANLAQSPTQTPTVEQLAVSVTPNFVNDNGIIGFGSYTYQYGYFSVAPGVTGMTLEHVAVTVDLDLTNVPLANTEIVLGRLATSTPYSLWGHVSDPVYYLSDQSVILYGESAAPGDVITEADGHQHLVFNYDTVQYMGENSAAPLGWALALVDTSTGQPFVYSPPNWNVKFYGAPTSQPEQWIFTDEYAGGASITPVTSSDSFNAAAATGNSVIDLRAGTSASLVNGISVTVNGNLGKGFGGDGNDTLYGNSTGNLLDGGRGDDALLGGAGNDIFRGGRGADTLTGGGGNDTYEFDANDGRDAIVNGATGNAGPSGRLALGAGLDLTRIWFSRSGDDLLLRAVSATDAVTIRSWFANDYSKLESVGDAAGRTIGVEKIGLFVRAMDAYLAANPGFDPSATGASNPLRAVLWDSAFLGNSSASAVDVRSVSNGPVSVPDNSHTIVIGSGDTVNIGAAINVGVIGSGDMVTASGAGDNVWIGGNGQNPSAADSNHVKLSQGTVTVSDNSRVDIEGNQVTEYIGSNVTTGIYGASNVVHVAGVGDEVWIGGNSHASAGQSYVYFSQGGKVVVENGSHADAFGDGVVAQLGSNVWAGILGNGDVVTATGDNDILWIQSNTSATVVGRGDTVNALCAGDTVRIGGNGRQSSDADKDYVYFSQGGTVTVSDNSHVDIFGHHITGSVGADVWAGFIGGGDTVNVSGANDTVWIGGNGQQASGADKDYVHFSQGGTAVVLNDSHVDIFGDRVTAQVGSNDWTGVFGRGETVTVSGSGDTIWIGGNGQNASAADLNHVNFSQSGTLVALDNSRVDVVGNNVTETIGSNVSTGVYGVGNTVSVSGPNDAIWIAGDADVNLAQGGRLTVYDDSHVDIVGGNVNAWVGSNVLIGLHGGGSGFGQDVVDGFNSTDTMQFGHSVFADWTHLLGAARQSGADTIIAISATDSVTLKNVAMSSLTQNQFQFV